tara:strand:- start:3093 stop:3884 length:792 start_codon:yes stop_codon:yes gene_type:complete
MGIITPLLDVVAGVAILAGRSSLLDTGVFKTANTNFTIRHILALGFIGVGVWNLWKIERAQDKLKKSLGAESFSAEKKRKKWTHRKWFINQKEGDEYYYEDDAVKYLAKRYGRWDLDIKPRYKNQDLQQMWNDLGLTGYQKVSVVIDAAIAQDKLQYLRIRDPEGQGTETRPRVIKKIIQEWGAESFGAEPMFVESDSLMVELMGFDGSYRTDGEVKVGYTTAAELGFEPKELKPVMWVWDDIEGYGAFMPTEKIRFIAEYFE